MLPSGCIGPGGTENYLQDFCQAFTLVAGLIPQELQHSGNGEEDRGNIHYSPAHTQQKRQIH